MKKISILTLFLLGFILVGCTNITNFSECEKAGNPTTGAYPGVCVDDGIEYLETSCPEYNEQSCPNSCAVCPPCEECSSLSCQTVEFCKSIGFDKKGSDNLACTKEYKPVCGKIDVQCITTPCNPVEETFGNICEADKRGAYDIKEGECQSDFEKCAAKGNPIMESYPRKCRDGDITYTEIIRIEPEIKDFWDSDDIILMQHESEGYYGCFGCSTPKDGKALCIDPIMGMKQVEETDERYCNSDFELIESNIN